MVSFPTLRLQLATITLAWCAALPIAEVLGTEILVSGFFSDSVARYDARTGTFRTTLEPATGLDGAIATRRGPDGKLYVASEGSNEVLRYDSRTGAFIDAFVRADTPGLDGPTGVTWDAAGDLYVSSFDNNSILKFNGETGALIETVASGNGLMGPDNGTVIGPDGMLYVPSFFNNRILRYDLTTGQSEIFVTNVFRPRVLVFHADGLLYVTSETTDSVRRYTSDGVFVDDFIKPGPAILDAPVGLAFHDNAWFVSSLSADKVLKFDAAGALVDADFIDAGAGGIDGPLFVTIIPEPSVAWWTLVMLIALVFRRRAVF